MAVAVGVLTGRAPRFVVVGAAVTIIKHGVSLIARTYGMKIDSPRRSILDLPGASALWTRDEAVRGGDGALADALGARRGRPAGVARGHLGGGTRGVRSPRGVVCVGRDDTEK